MHAAEGAIYEIYTIKVDGTDAKRITHDKGINTYPSYSRDGRQILFRKVLGEIWASTEYSTLGCLILHFWDGREKEIPIIMIDR